MIVALVSAHTGLLIVAVLLLCFALFGAIVVWDNHWEKKQKEEREKTHREWEWKANQTKKSKKWGGTD